jgi:5-methylcytosine-specific restriction endonuclease McrA
MKWRREVFTRDAFVCQKCGCKKGDDEYTVLVAHHMESFEDYPEGRLDIDNGVTLCDDCHKEFNHRYGTKHNRKWQTDEFMED